MTKITASTTFDIYSVFTKNINNFGRGMSVSGVRLVEIVVVEVPVTPKTVSVTV
jgi:hypothetical protein